ncbi:hypothetical protein NONO_c20950 [Nocardia nova SH22a]|uniref:Uncharacterized protein n=1 Tax=Nocardia nova SH22a TaxID=1415166 RepID=W5TD73_9NOCA|nr:hypothetical protein [Nocardia nova]AHH16893.1 hypothetical protein NONO_c20950 [Nocardia nova SH22a]
METDLKLAIGTHAGIDGVATWETDLKSRRINPDLVQTREPELFEQCTELRLSAKEFETLLKAPGRAHECESFQEVTQARQLKIAEQ